MTKISLNSLLNKSHISRKNFLVARISSSAKVIRN